MKRNWWYLFCVFVLLTNVFFAFNSLHTTRETLHGYQTYIDQDAASLHKLKKRVLETTKPEYEETVSKSMDSYVELSFQGNQHVMEALKYSQRVSNEASMFIAF